MNVWDDDKDIVRKPRPSVWRLALAAVGLFVLSLALMSCATTPSRSGMVEIRYFETVPDGVNIDRALFKLIAGSKAGSEWQSVGEFENGRLVAWWQERKF